MKTFDGFLHVSMRSPGVEAEDERKVVYTVSIKHVVLKMLHCLLMKKYILTDFKNATLG